MNTHPIDIAFRASQEMLGFGIMAFGLVPFVFLGIVVRTIPRPRR
jgi:hypothetical protein